MTKKEASLKAGLYINRIALSLDNDNFNKVKDDLQELEAIIKKILEQGVTE